MPARSSTVLPVDKSISELQNALKERQPSAAEEELLYATLVPLLLSTGLPLAVESCPHYLNFASEEVSDGATILKCAPPIRDSENREAIWQGLKDGIVDSLASDHSPCPNEMKMLAEGDFSSAWGGISGGSSFQAAF